MDKFIQTYIFQVRVNQTLNRKIIFKKILDQEDDTTVFRCT